MELFKVYSGEEFNRIANEQQIKFYKLTNFDEYHNSFQFNDGLNIDTVPFNPLHQCSPGGIYFTETKLLRHWTSRHVFIREVIIPDDAKVYVEQQKFKANKIILKPRKYIIENENLLSFRGWFKKEMKMKDKFFLTNIDNQTEIICDIALSVSVGNFKYIKNKTAKQIIRCVKIFGPFLKLEETQPVEICMRAVMQHGLALEHVKEQSDSLCMEAVMQNGIALKFVKKQTYTICREAITQNPKAIKFVKNKTPDLLRLARRIKGFS